MIDISILNKLNAPTKEERLANLKEVLKDTTFPPMVPQYINNHIHTTYSFSPYSPTAAVYAAQQEEKAKQHHGFVQPGTDEKNLIFASCVPWVAFTQVIQPTPIPADSNPRIVFGKYIKEGERTLMPLHIQCNHALVDGWHIGEFYRIFQEMADAL